MRVIRATDPTITTENWGFWTHDENKQKHWWDVVSGGVYTENLRVYVRVGVDSPYPDREDMFDTTGKRGIVEYSTDKGETWHEAKIPEDVISWEEITYCEGLFVTSDYHGTIAYCDVMHVQDEWSVANMTNLYSEEHSRLRRVLRVLIFAKN